MGRALHVALRGTTLEEEEERSRCIRSRRRVRRASVGSDGRAGLAARLVDASVARAGFEATRATGAGVRFGAAGGGRRVATHCLASGERLTGAQALRETAAAVTTAVSLRAGGGGRLHGGRHMLFRGRIARRAGRLERGARRLAAGSKQGQQRQERHQASRRRLPGEQVEHTDR
jgi:hypothetical protein